MVDGGLRCWSSPTPAAILVPTDAATTLLGPVQESSVQTTDKRVPWGGYVQRNRPGLIDLGIFGGSPYGGIKRLLLIRD